MKQNTFLYSLLFILVCLNVWVCYRYYTTQQEKNNLYKGWLDCKSNADLQAYTNDNLKAISKIQFIAEGEIARNVKLYDVEGKEAGSLQKQLSSEPKLIFFFSNRGCAGCYEPVLYKLDKWVEKIGKEHLLVLADFPNQRTMDVYWSEKRMDLPIYRIQEDLDLVRSLNDSHYAYAFLMDQSRVARKFIITDKSNVSFSDAYFDLLGDYWPPKR